jgi:hypothetical protein
MRGNPDLFHRRIRADNELGLRLFELYRKRPAIEVRLKLVRVGSSRQLFIEIFEGLIRSRFELLFVH